MKQHCWKIGHRLSYHMYVLANMIICHAKRLSKHTSFWQTVPLIQTKSNAYTSLICWNLSPGTSISIMYRRSKHYIRFFPAKVSEHEMKIKQHRTKAIKIAGGRIRIASVRKSKICFGPSGYERGNRQIDFRFWRESQKNWIIELSKDNDNNNAQKNISCQFIRTSSVRNTTDKACLTANKKTSVMTADDMSSWHFRGFRFNL